MATMGNSLIATVLRKLQVNKGAPRVWMQGRLPARAGFLPGVKYSVEQPSAEDRRVVLKLDPAGTRVVSVKIDSHGEQPVIDVNCRRFLGVFEGMNAVRIVIRQGEIHILPDAVEVKKADRARRLEQALSSKTVSVASVSHGAGILSNALHVGLKQAGLHPHLVWANEIRDEVMEQAVSVNEAWDENTIALTMPIQQLAFADDYTLNRLPRPIILEGGLPCTAASLSGRAKKSLRMAEDDEEAGHLVAAFIALIAKVNPVLVLLENVVPYYRTASASILRTVLKELGYNVQELDIDGGEYAIESRPRRVLVAITEGVEFDLAAMLAPPKQTMRVVEILDPVPLDDPSWSTMDYLVKKEARDKEAGKGFAMQRIELTATKVGTLGKGYQKNRSTEPKLVHPHDPRLMRLFTPAEHARLKGVPPHLIDGIDSKTFAHEILGQSVTWPAFRQLGEHLGHALSRGIVKVQKVVEDVVVQIPVKPEPAAHDVENLPLFAVA